MDYSKSGGPKARKGAPKFEPHKGKRGPQVGGAEKAPLLARMKVAAAKRAK